MSEKSQQVKPKTVSQLQAEARERQKRVDHFAASALIGMLSFRYIEGRKDSVCQEAYKWGETMVVVSEGEQSIDQLRHDIKVERENVSAKNQELADLIERHKLLTIQAEKTLTPTAE